MKPIIYSRTEQRNKARRKAAWLRYELLLRGAVSEETAVRTKQLAAELGVSHDMVRNSTDAMPNLFSRGYTSAPRAPRIGVIWAINLDVPIHLAVICEDDAVSAIKPRHVEPFRDLVVPAHLRCTGRSSEPYVPLRGRPGFQLVDSSPVAEDLL